MKKSGLTYIIDDLSLIRKDIIRDNSIVIKLSNPEDVVGVFQRYYGDYNIFQICLDLGFGSLSQIQFNKDWENIPLLIFAYNLGDLNYILNIVGLIQSCKIRVMLPSSNKETYASLKILSSLGVDCGIFFNQEHADSETFLDLASYYYMSPVPHASIEPFANVKENIHQDHNHSFDEVYFIDEKRFIYIHSENEFSFAPQSKRLSLYLSDDDLEKEQVNFKLKNYYGHFMELDQCSKCKAFKICNHKLNSSFNYDCQQVMADVFEYAEISETINR